MLGRLGCALCWMRLVWVRGGQGDPRAPPRALPHPRQVDRLDLTRDPVYCHRKLLVDVLAVPDRDDQPALRALRVDPGTGQQRAIGIVDPGRPGPGIPFERLQPEPVQPWVVAEVVAEVVELRFDCAV